MNIEYEIRIFKGEFQFLRHGEVRVTNVVRIHDTFLTQ